MSEGGSDSEDGHESPIFGFSYDEEGKPHSFWAIDPNVEVESEQNTFDKENLVNEETSQKPCSPPKSVRFCTASGKPIAISEKALLAAKKKMEPDTVENGGTSDEKITQNLMSSPDLVEFSTAGEDKSELTKKNIMESEIFKNNATSTGPTFLEPTSPPKFVRFSTASGKPIAISEKALSQAKKKMESETFEDDGNLFGKTSQELMPPPPPPKFVRFSTASGKPISVSEKAMEEAKKKFDFDTFNNEGQEVNTATNIGPVPCSSQVFDFGNQSCLSPELSNEVDDLTRSLLEDISASNESEWVQEDMQQESQPVNPVIEPEKIEPEPAPEIEAQKARTSTKRRILEQYGEPPDLPPLCTPAKRGRLTKKFVPPRPADPK